MRIKQLNHPPSLHPFFPPVAMHTALHVAEGTLYTLPSVPARRRSTEEGSMGSSNQGVQTLRCKHVWVCFCLGPVTSGASTVEGSDPGYPGSGISSLRPLDRDWQNLDDMDALNTIPSVLWARGSGVVAGPVRQLEANLKPART